MANKTDEERYSPNLHENDIDDRFNQIMSGEGVDMTAYNDQAEAIERDIEKQRKKESNPDTPETVNDREGLRDAEDEPNNGIPFQPIRQEERQKSGRMSRLFGKKKTMIYGGMGLGGGTILVLMLLGSLMPLKLDALLKNINQYVSRVPSYAVEQRTEYLITRALATRVLMLHNNVTSEADGKLAFCGNGSITCSLFTTYTADVFEREMNFDLTKTSNGVRLTVNPKGRQYLGGPATSWNIDMTRDGNWGNLNDNVTRTIRKIESHADMRLYLKNTIDKKLAHKSILTRYVARKILMKKYGVRHWRAFETQRDKWDKKIADTKTAFRVGMYENTVAKLSPRYAVWLACISDPGGADACEQLLKRMQATIGTPTAPSEGDPDYDTKLKQYERDKNQMEALQKIEKTISGEVGEDIINSVGKKFLGFFTTKLVPILSVFSVINMVMNAVKGLDDGVLTIVNNDMVAQAATGLAFGATTSSATSGVGVVTNIEKMRAGGFGDMTGGELIGELGTLIDCQGPLCAAQNGFLGSSLSTASAASGQYEVECSANGENKKTLLEPGEMICYNQRFNRYFTKDLESNPLYQAIIVFKDVWFGSGVGHILNFIDQFVGAVFGAILDQEPIKSFIAGISDAIKPLLEPALNYFVDLFFNPPFYGPDAPVGANYVGLSSALALESYEMMYEGIGEDGQVWGGGGAFLYPEQVNALVAYQEQEELKERNSLPWYARMFDINVKGSLTQLAVLQTPTTSKGVVEFPSRMFASVMRAPFTNTKALSVTNNPHNLLYHSYALNDPVLTANPDVYTPKACEASKQARLESYDRIRGVTPVKVFQKSDPCALEKLSVGSAVTPINPKAEGAFPDPYNISIGTLPSDNNGTATSEAAGWTRAQLSQASDHIACAPGSEEVTPSYTAHDDGKPIQIKLCKLTAVPVPSVASWNYEGIKAPVFASIISAKYVEMMTKLYNEGGGRPVILDSFRSYERQRDMRVNNGCAWAINDYSSCPGKPETAVPGYSNHETGYATDFYRQDSGWPKVETWLRANAGTFCFEYLKSPLERWHWQPTALRTGANCEPVNASPQGANPV